MPFRICLAGLLIASAAPPGAAQTPPDPSGVWVLDAVASDTVPLPPSADDDRREGVRVTIGRPARIPHSRSIQDPHRMRQAVDAVRTPAARIFLVRDDSTVTLSFDAEAPVTLRTDGRAIDRFWTDGEPVEIRTRWKDGTLRIERKLENGLEILDSYAVENGALVVRTVVEGPIPRRIEVERVYRRPPAG